MLEQHPLAHFVYDPTSLRMLAANRVALQRYGYSRDELLSLTRADLLEPSELRGLRDFIATLPDSAITLRDRVWLERTRDGRVLHASVRGMPVRFAGRDARLVAVVDAGTQARLAADAELARDLLVKAGSMAQLGGWSLDLVARRVHWSDVVFALHELPPGSECELDRAIEFYPDEAGVALHAAVEQCTAAGIAFDLELPFVGARGTERWVRVVGAAVRDGAGRVVRVEGAQQDITARRRTAMALEQTRQRHAALLAAIPDLWMVIDADGRYCEVSDPRHPGLSAPWADKLGRRLIDSIGPTLALPIKRLGSSTHTSRSDQRLVLA